MAAPEFALDVSQNRYLSTEDDTMDAILTVTTGDIAVSGSGVAAEVILMDCSGSMSMPPTKIAAARRAAAAAVDALRDGTFFAIVQGTHDAEMCYPATPHMAVADATTKAEAKARIARMPASGGTAMGTWLTLARELFRAHPAAIRHAVLLTDGENEHETREELDRVLAACDGQFFCDARGIGDDWDPRELRRIVTVLRGTADAVRREADLVDDFRALAKAAMTKVVPDLRIRVTTMRGAELRRLKQAYPRELDFTGNPVRKPTSVDGRTVWEFSTGSWSASESRDYQLSLRVHRDERDPVFEDLLGAEIELLARPEGAEGAAQRCAPPQPVEVHWTTDPALSSRFDPKVAHYTGQAELNEAVLAGWDAYDAGRPEETVRAWGNAVRLATESGNAQVLTRLKRLVDVVDADRGIVRIKPDLSRSDLLNAAVGSNISSRAPAKPRLDPDPGVDNSVKSDLTCPNPECGRTLPGTAKYCQCGTPVGEQDR
jgi:Ca-activated chloride channel family protein